MPSGTVSKTGMSSTIREIADHVGGRALGDPTLVVRGASSLALATPDDIVFVDGATRARELSASRAGAVLLRPGTPFPDRMVAIEVERPAVAMARVLDLLRPPERQPQGISPFAAIGERVIVADGVAVGAFVSIGDDAVVGQGTEIRAGSVVGRRVRIGRDCCIHPRVVIEDDTEIGDRVILHGGVVLGADGFGFVVDHDAGGRAFHRKLQQIGRVVIEDDVEIGANSAVDRAAFGETRVGAGTKIDNLVTVGHNCRLGRHCIVVGQAGISGSTTLGDYVTLAGQAGLSGHLTIGDGAVVGAQAGVTKDVPAGAVVLGSPAIDVRRARKAYSLIDTLPEMRARIVALERALAAAGLTAPDAGRDDA